MRRLVLAAVPVLALAATGHAGTAFLFTVNQSTSTLSYNFSASAPFAGTLVGANDPAQPTTAQTRTKHMTSVFSCGTFGATTNETIGISGTIAATGSSATPSTIHPGGTFKLGIDAAAGTSTLQDFNVNLVAGGPISTTANLNGFNWDTPGFCTVNPSCTLSHLLAPLNLPVGSVSITALQAAQAAGVPDVGTLTPSGANTWTFSVNTTLTITPTVTFQGSAIPADPQQIPTTVNGTITVSGTTATVTASVAINYNPPANTTPSPQPATPMTLPPDSLVCANINIILTITVNSSTVSNSSTASLAANGTPLACPCDANASGGLEVQDIFDYLNLWFAGNPRADFNGTGGITVQDIFDFLGCWFNRPLGCS